MDVLEQIYAEHLQQKFAPKLEELSAIDLWSKENRDSKVDDLISTFRDIAEESSGFIKELVETEVAGKFLIHYVLHNMLLIEVLTLLRGLRSQLDVATEEEKAEFPVDYEWLNSKIHDVCVLLESNQKVVESHVSMLQKPVAEEL